MNGALCIIPPGALDRRQSDGLFFGLKHFRSYVVTQCDCQKLLAAGARTNFMQYFCRLMLQLTESLPSNHVNMYIHICNLFL